LLCTKEVKHVTASPTYYPSTEQFEDPVAYISSIWSDAQAYGICRIVPPAGWKVDHFIIFLYNYLTRMLFKMLSALTTVTVAN
jgi:hypothetical protein